MGVGVIIIFGPDKPGKVQDSEGVADKAKKLGVTGVACFSIAMLLFTLMSDTRDVMDVWHAGESGGNRTFAVFVILATSTNQVAVWSIYGIMRLYGEADPGGEGVEKMWKEKGLATFIYFCVSMPLMTMSALLLIFAAPAFVAYLPFLLPLILALEIQATLVMNFAAWRRAPDPADDARFGNEWLFAHFGSSSQGLFEYVHCATFWPWLVCFCVPLACRLYSGHGYWESLSHTLTDRYLQDYLITVKAAMEHKILFVWAFLP